MKKYTNKQIASAISYWSKRLVNESLKDDTKAKLDKAGLKFAKAFGDCIKGKQAGRIEDENNDALVAIKKTIRVNSNVKANPMASMFVQQFFDGDLRTLNNLMKTTEQFNYFANVVFGVWHRDPELSGWLKKNLPKNAKRFDSVEEYIASLAGENNGVEEPEDEDQIEGNEEDEEPMQEGAIGAGLGALGGKKLGEIVGKHFKKDTRDTVDTVATAAGAIGGAMLEEDPGIEAMSDEEFIGKGESAETANGNPTVGDLIRVLKTKCSLNDTILTRVNKKECFIFDIYSKGGRAVIDMVPGSVNRR